MEVDIPLFSGVYKNVDSTVLVDKNHKLMDGILDEGPSIFSRPGLSLEKTSASGMAFDGLIWIDKLSLLFGVSGGVLYSYTAPNSTIPYSETSFATAGVSLRVGTRPTFAFDGTRLYVANGARIVYTDALSPVSAYIADAQAPVNVTHVILFDTYLIANNTSNDTWYFSNVGDPLNWSALDFASAEAEPDAIIAAIKFRSEIYFFGRETLEVWENDGETPFVRVNGGVFDTGCIAPYSVIALDNEVMWLSDDRRFVKFGGGGVEKISTQYDKEISGFSVVSDCTADRYDILGKTLIIFQFPSEQRTLVYNLTNDNWCEFGFWNSAGGFHEAFLGACHAFIPETGFHIVGARKQTGKLYKMAEENFLDDSSQIKLIAQSGHINYGTNKTKRNDFMTLRVKRGYVTDSSEPVATMRFRDNNGSWSNEIPISLGVMGDYYNVAKITRTGRFESRQYEFSCSDPVGFVFSEAKEEFQVMNR